MLDAGEVGALRALGMEIGSHAHSHRSLRALGDAEVLDELETSRAVLERASGGLVRAICYPYGHEDARVRALAGRAGYHAGVVSVRRLNSRRTDPLRLARLWIDHRTSVTGLRGMLVGLRLVPS